MGVAELFDGPELTGGFFSSLLGTAVLTNVFFFMVA